MRLVACCMTHVACVCVCRDKPRLISDGERMAALFNIACCHSQLGDSRSGLVALAGVRRTPGQSRAGSTGSLSRVSIAWPVQGSTSRHAAAGPTMCMHAAACTSPSGHACPSRVSTSARCSWRTPYAQLLALCVREGCLELGYTDFAQLRGDPDLANLRSDERFEVGHAVLPCCWGRGAALH